MNNATIIQMLNSMNASDVTYEEILDSLKIHSQNPRINIHIKPINIGEYDKQVLIAILSARMHSGVSLAAEDLVRRLQVSGVSLCNGIINAIENLQEEELILVIPTVNTRRFCVTQKAIDLLI